MAIAGPYTTYAVGTSAVEIYTPANSADSEDVVIGNQGPDNLMIGQSGVSSTTGLVVASGEQVVLQGVPAAVYGICASGDTATAAVGFGSVVSIT